MDWVNAIKRPLQGGWKTIILGSFFALFWPFKPFLHGFGILSQKEKDFSKKVLDLSELSHVYGTGLIPIVIASIYLLPGIILLAVASSIRNVLSFLFELGRFFFFFWDVPTVANSLTSALSAVRLVVQLVVSPEIYPLVNNFELAAMGIFLIMVGAIVFPAGIYLFIQNRKLSSAFDFGKVIKVLLSIKYWMVLVFLFAYASILFYLVPLLTNLFLSLIKPFFSSDIGSVTLLLYLAGILGFILYAIASYLWWMTAYFLLSELPAGKEEFSNNQSKEPSFGWKKNRVKRK